MNTYGKFDELIREKVAKYDARLNAIEAELIYHDSRKVQAIQRLTSERDELTVKRGRALEYHIANGVCPECFIEHNHLRKLTDRPSFCFECRHECPSDS